MQRPRDVLRGLLPRAGFRVQAELRLQRRVDALEHLGDAQETVVGK